MLIMLTIGRAQPLVLNATELEGLGAYRLLLRRFEPVSTVTTVSKLVDLLASASSGDLMDSLHVLGAEETWFSGTFAHQHCWHDRMDEICERDRKR